MKRPFAVIGFSMLASTLLFYNISFKASVAVAISATVLFCFFIAFKSIRKNKTILFALASVVLYFISFIFCQFQYVKTEQNMGEMVKIEGVVCQAPSHSDYAHTYIIKPNNANYKIRYVSRENRFFTEGTVVSGTVKRETSEFIESDFLDSSLSSKIYFTFFETEDFKLERTDEFNFVYKILGEIKSNFSNLTCLYIPGENSGIANAMAVGDRSGISATTMENFNYAGSSHLLVVSGLHLSLWAFGTIKILRKSSFLRRYSVFISFAVLIFYSALTGFSVSVIRAGAMVGAVIISKAFHRDADSLNSIGIGIAGILIFNPFAAYSVSLWFTVLSTVGILVLQKPLENLIYSTTIGEKIKKFSFFRFLVTSSTVSLSASICTLPVFIIKFGFLPWASVISNLLMVDIAMVVMVITVAGAFLHCLHLYPLAQLAYGVSGALSGFLRSCAEKIGLSELSGLPMSNDLYKWFILIAIFCVVVAYGLRKKLYGIPKLTAIVLSTTFIMISIFSTIHNYNTPTVEIAEINSQPIIHINYKGESILVGCGDKSSVNWVKDALNHHGQKSPELLVITNENDSTYSQIIKYQQSFNFSEVAFCSDGLSMFDETTENINTLSIGGDFTIDFSHYETRVEFAHNSKNIVYIYGETEENLFKNGKVYDTIIVYTPVTVPEDLEVVRVNDGETATIKF